MASYSALITSGEEIIAGGQILRMAISRFVDVSEEKMVSQQILTTLMTGIIVDKSTDHAKPHSIFFYHNIIKITKEIVVNICSQLKKRTPTWKCIRCIMQMSYLYASDFPLENFFNMQKQ